MDDRARITELIDCIVRDAKIEDIREREGLRRELESHFADAADSPPAVAAAVERFGDPRVVSERLEQAHRRRRFVRHAARVATAIVASAVIALVVQIIANMPLDWSATAAGFGHSFFRSISFSLMIVVVLVAAWELDIESLCARLERQPLRLTLTLVALATTMLLFHAFEATPLLPAKAFVESGLDMIVWACTIAILARLDRAFAGVFTRAKP